MAEKETFILKKASTLRLQAERITAKLAENQKSLTPEEIRQTFHELQVHQIELEMQNEELKRTQLELDAARARYFNLYDLAPVGYCTISEKGLILEVNLTAATLLGMARDMLVMQPISRFLRKEDQDIYYLYRKKLFETGEPQTCELRMVKKDGTSFWVRLEATVVQDADSTPEYRIVMSDITGSKLAEELLSESDAQFRVIFEVASIGIVQADRITGRILRCNETYCRITGYPLSELLGISFSDFTHPEDRQRDWDLFSRAARGETPVYRNEKRYIRKDGSIVWVRLEAVFVRDSNGQAIRTVAVCEDITEHRRARAYGEIGREVLQILNEPGDLRNSIQRVLTVLKTRTGFDAVGIRLQDEDDFPYFVQEGFTKDFLLTENTLIERNADGRVCRDKDGGFSLECTCGLVISGKTDPTNPLFTSGGSCWTNDSSLLLDIPPGEDPRRNPRNQCIHQGYASVALVPIRNKDRNVGLIQFNDRRKGCFTLDTVEILEGIATHIGEALMRKRVEEELWETQAILKAAMDNSQVGIAIADAPSGVLRYVNAAGLFIRGGDIQSIINGVGIDQYVASWQLMNFDGNPLKPDEVPLARAIMFGEICSREFIIRRTIDDDRIVLAKAAPIMDDNGKVVAGVVAFMDITERKHAEEKLRASLAEKEVLLKEVHHRVKNNLQIISSLISLQADSQVDEQLHGVLSDVRNRVRTMALVHEKLYQTDDLTRLDFAEYSDGLLQNLWSAYGSASGKVRLNLSLAPLILPVDLAMQCALILNELTTNAFKHAFPGGREGEVSVSLEHDPAIGAACLRVRDNGVGLPVNYDWRQSSSLGLRLVQMLTGQMRGTVQTGPGPGTEFQINFNVKGITS